MHRMAQCTMFREWVGVRSCINSVILYATSTRTSVVTRFKDHGICKSRINYSIAYPKPRNKRYCSQYMVAVVILKPS